jgi:hypothetical protein
MNNILYKHVTMLTFFDQPSKINDFQQKKGVTYV